MKKSFICATISVCIAGFECAHAEGTVGYWNMQDNVAGTVAKNGAAVKSSVNSPILDAKILSDRNTKVEFIADVPGKVIVAGKDAEVVNSDNKSSLKVTSKYGIKSALSIRGDNLLNLDAFTVEAFFKVIKMPNWSGLMMRKRVEEKYSWIVYNENNSGILRLRVDSNPPDTKSRTGFNQSVRTDFTINDGKWHHIAITYDALTNWFCIYGDYKLLAKMKIPLPAVYDDSPMIFLGGTHAGAAEEYVDEIRVSDKVLSIDEFLKVK